MAISLSKQPRQRRSGTSPIMNPVVAAPQPTQTPFVVTATPTATPRPTVAPKSSALKPRRSELSSGASVRRRPRGGLARWIVRGAGRGRGGGLRPRAGRRVLPTQRLRHRVRGTAKGAYGRPQERPQAAAGDVSAEAASARACPTRDDGFSRSAPSTATVCRVDRALARGQRPRRAWKLQPPQALP